MALSNDIRNRVVNAYTNNEGTFNDIALRFSIGSASAKRWCRRKRETGSVDRKSMPGRPPKISVEMYPQLEAIVAENADATLKQLAEKWNEKHGVLLAVSTMNDVLQRAGITYKKNVSGQRTPNRKISKTAPRLFRPA